MSNITVSKIVLLNKRMTIKYLFAFLCLFLCLFLIANQAPQYNNKNQQNNNKVEFKWITPWHVHKIIGFTSTPGSGYQFGDKIAVFWEAEIQWKCEDCGIGRYRIYEKTEKKEDTNFPQNSHLWLAPYYMDPPIIEYTGVAILQHIGIPTSFIDLVIDYINKYFVNNINPANVNIPLNTIKPQGDKKYFFHQCNQ